LNNLLQIKKSKSQKNIGIWISLYFDFILVIPSLRGISYEVGMLLSEAKTISLDSLIILALELVLELVLVLD
jgi:hypothetical protein